MSLEKHARTLGVRVPDIVTKLDQILVDSTRAHAGISATGAVMDFLRRKDEPGTLTKDELALVILAGSERLRELVRVPS